MRRWIQGLGMALAMVLLLGGCGGGDGDGVSSTPCGSLGLSPKIVNGTNCASPELSPVVLLFVVNSAGGVASCSGTMISNDKILTAAHCVRGSVRRVVTPVWRADGSAAEMNARRWVAHPGFASTASGYVNDVAVVFLPSALPNPTMPLLVSEPSAAKQSVFFAGWGAPGFQLAVGTAVLDRVTTEQLAHHFKGAGSNTCGGDSGGPMYRQTGAGQGLIGVTSFGSTQTCGAEDFSVYTNLQSPAVQSFIRAQVPEAASI